MMKRPPKDLGKAIKSGYQPMFMTGPEIKEHFPPLEGDKKPITTKTETRTETNSELWDRKLKESKYTGEQRFGEMAFAMGRPQQYGIARTTTLAGVAAAKGMPGHIAVQIGNASDNGQILGGHHRVALSAEQFKEHIFPVKYHRNLKEAQDDPGYR
jgi:hypothetical protein